MKAVDLDLSKLLGFRLSQSTETGSVVSAKVGNKAGLKAGNKVAEAKAD